MGPCDENEQMHQASAFTDIVLSLTKDDGATGQKNTAKV